MSRNIYLLGAVALAVMSAACAKPPQAQIDAANAALTNATGAGASEYAPEAYSAARDAQAKLDAELKAQEGKFALTRSYTEVTTLVTAATEAAEKAASEATQRKQAAQTEASTLIADARTAIEGAETALTSAPKGKGSQADLAALQSDLTAAKSALGEAETALSGQHYLDAKAKAEASKERAGSVKSAVDQAIQTRQGARRRG